MLLYIYIHAQDCLCLGCSQIPYAEEYLVNIFYFATPHWTNSDYAAMEFYGTGYRKQMNK